LGDVYLGVGRLAGHAVAVRVAGSAGTQAGEALVGGAVEVRVEVVTQEAARRTTSIITGAFSTVIDAAG
jgi:hypothetical protein